MRTSLRFLTWLDVKRFIRDKTNDGNNLPQGITKIGCFSDALEVILETSESRQLAITTFKEWFSNWYVEDQSAIQLDLGEATLPIEFIEDSSYSNAERVIRPSWQEISYLQPETTAEKNHISLPHPLTSNPEIFAFYSFKGGVGRTLHLASYLFALLDTSRDVDKPVKILVIDADLEAPGLTYWDKLEAQTSNISFLDFLEAYHYSPVEKDATLETLAKEIRKTPRKSGKSVYYFLPACLEDSELLDTPVLPEHLSRSPEGAWSCVDAIHHLGKKLEVNYILIDLRAGLSEISSPILFDPRVHRICVTPASEQSVSGISLVLKQIGRVSPSDTDVEEGRYHDPSIIISLLTKELRNTSIFEDTLERLRSSYQQQIQDNDELLSNRILEIEETNFAQELLHINTWSEAHEKLSEGTSVFTLARKWASAQLTPSRIQSDLDSTSIEDVRKLKEICRKYEFAESGQGESLLVTESLRNIATSFVEELPRVVSIGSKGAGKTFTYLQIARSKSWEAFLDRVLDTTNSSEEKVIVSHILPILQSKNLTPDATKIVSDARKEVASVLEESVAEFSYSDCSDRIIQNLSNSSWTQSDWHQFWIKELAQSVGLNSSRDTLSLKHINDFLRDKNLRFVFLFDGLEDIFTYVSSNVQHQNALRALIDFPRRLSEFRHSSVGMIILLRRDFVKYLLPQNPAQFENLYKSYDLFWDADSFLKLVFWICSQAKIIHARESDVDGLSREQLIEKIELLWGKKLGLDTSKEAYTPNWIFAALTDFKGRLQARDVVRFLYHAADITINQTKEVQFEKWSHTRLLPPQSIRHALAPCSEKKVNETKQEYPEFEAWVDLIENKLPRNQRRVPFFAEELELDKSIIRMLEDIGVIYEDTEKKNEAPKFYMPEIFRTGLNFTIAKGARPRVLVLKRKALGAMGIL
jgi:cellulose biosynthesis protein BcsQ